MGGRAQRITSGPAEGGQLVGFFTVSVTPYAERRADGRLSTEPTVSILQVAARRAGLQHCRARVFKVTPIQYFIFWRERLYSNDASCYG